MRFLIKLVLCCAISAPAIAIAQSGNLELDAVLLESSDLMQAGKPEAALAMLKRYEATYSSQPEFLNNLAVAYLGTAQPVEALTILRQMVDSDPIFSIVTHNLLELELQIAETPPDTFNPVLFVQSTSSFFQTGLADLAKNNSPSVQPVAANPSPAVSMDAPTLQVSQPLTLTGSMDQSALESSLIQQTENWAAAWSAKDTTGYLSAYAEDYQPDSTTSHSAWRNSRIAALDRPGEIAVRLSEFQLTISDDRAEVQFVQDYSSRNYSDRVRKTLVYSRLEERWKIVSETSITLE